MANHASPAVVVKVGGGRGFIIEHRVKVPPMKSRLRHQPRRVLFAKYRLVITAAHCLPHLPPVLPACSEERTYKDLLGNLDGSKKDVWRSVFSRIQLGTLRFWAVRMVKNCPTRPTPMTHSLMNDQRYSSARVEVAVVGYSRFLVIAGSKQT
jgi:hypothetical protein